MHLSLATTGGNTMKASPDSQHRFLAATGFNMYDLYILIGGLVCTAIFVWSAWVALSHYEQWAQGRNNITLFDVMWGVTRSVILLSIVIYLVNQY